MELEIFQVDSFTLEEFKGNPAGVCITKNALDEALMFAIAAEMAVSETAFLSLSDLRLRWFTPQVEVKLCGHGTLAVVHVLKEKGLLGVGDELAFNTLSGALRVKIENNHIEMDFPAARLDFDASVDEQMLAFLGLSAAQVVSHSCFDSKNLIEIVSEQTLLALKPNYDGLKQLPGRGVLVTAKSASKDVDFISRYFAPWVGINEDPVTGSAHCALAVYWGDKLQKTKLKGYQASERGGFVDVERLPNQRVKLMGQAVTVLKGTMYV